MNPGGDTSTTGIAYLLVEGRQRLYSHAERATARDCGAARTSAARPGAPAWQSAAISDFTIVNLRDVEDAAPRFGLGHQIEARFAREALGAERTGMSLQRLAPGSRAPFGHRHAEQEETYVILEGSGRVKLGDELREVRPLDAVRVAPGVMRAFEAGPEGLEYLAFGGPTTGGNDSEIDPGWWVD